MSISRINTNEHSRAIDAAFFWRDYTEMHDQLAAQAAGAVAPAPPPPLTSPVKVIDNPRRGSRAFMQRTAGTALNRVSHKRRYGDSADVVQGDIAQWHRMDRHASAAPDAIPQGDEMARGMRVDKPYMRRVGENSGRTSQAELPVSAATQGSKSTGKRQYGLGKALRERAQFTRWHVVMLEVPTLPPSGLALT
jgi:hypothetical protein